MGAVQPTPGAPGRGGVKYDAADRLPKQLRADGIRRLLDEGVTVIEIAEVLGTSRQAPHQQVSLSNRGCHCNETQHVCQRPLKSCAGPTAIAAPTGAWSP